MTTDNYMADISNDASKFQSSWFSRHCIKAQRVIVWNQISSISNKEHVTNILLNQTGHYESTVHARKHYGSRLQGKKLASHSTTKSTLAIHSKINKLSRYTQTCIPHHLWSASCLFSWLFQIIFTKI